MSTPPSTISARNRPLAGPDRSLSLFMMCSPWLSSLLLEPPSDVVAERCDGLLPVRVAVEVPDTREAGPLSKCQ